MGAPPGACYEFSATENQTIGKCALWARVLAGAMFVSGLGTAINKNVVGALISIAVAIFFFQGGNALSNVVESQGNDVHHLMEALTKISQAFQIRIIATMIGAVLVLCALIALMAVGGAALGSALG